MITKSLLAFASLFLASTYGLSHHAACVTADDSFMTCGAHSGPVSFELQKFGPVTTKSQQLLLCNNRGAKVEKLVFSWVESDDKESHFAMENIKYRAISDSCNLLGGLNFTPPSDFEKSEQNAWRLDIYIEGKDFPSSVYVEAVAE